MSLRLRLLSGLGALVVAALAALAVGTTIAFRHNLIGRLDNQLATASASLSASMSSGSSTDSAARYGGSAAGGSGGPGGPATRSGTSGRVTSGTGIDGTGSSGRAAYYPRSGGAPSGRGGIDAFPVGPTSQVRAAAGPDDYVEYLGNSGSVLSVVRPTVAGGADRPVFAAGIDAAALDPGTTRVFSARGLAGGSERVAVTTLPDGTGVLVAGPLQALDATIRHLIEVEAGIGGIVLLATLGLGVLLARHLTRPLEQIARTADAITNGDLGRRVPIATGRSEVARVGAALNAMLASITAAFARRDATELRLRQFVADASHELATPLTSIRGYAELFDRGLAERPEDLRTAMTRIEAEARRMGGLVDDLLVLAHLDGTNAAPPASDPYLDPDDAWGARRTVDLTTIATDAAADLQVADPRRPVRLLVAGPVIVVGDDDRLRQVAANLASNARRHTPAGTPVTISSRVEDGRALLEVTDEGPGLAPGEVARVFERLYRVDPARSRMGGGSGLGLAIVAAIAEAHGGRATVRSTPGSGATFTITLPAAPG